jgi:hypothetical protein
MFLIPNEKQSASSTLRHPAPQIEKIGIIFYQELCLYSPQAKYSP